MKTHKKILGLCIMATVTLSGTSLLRVAAQSVGITGDQAERIQTSCVSTKNTLNQLHASDALLRVNRGQIYESMSTKLMEKFNKRLSSNNYNSLKLESITTAYGQLLNTFRSDYISYEEHLSAAMSIDCQKQQSTFYNAVLDARTKRDQVHSDVVQLNKLIDSYQSAVDQFEKDYQKSAGAQ